MKVQAKNGSTVNPDAEYHLSFQTTQADKSHGAYQEMAEVQKYEGTVRKQMQEGLTDTEETRAIKEIRQKYKAIIQSRWRNCIRNRQKMLCEVGSAG